MPASEVGGTLPGAPNPYALVCSYLRKIHGLKTSLKTSLIVLIHNYNLSIKVGEKK